MVKYITDDSPGEVPYGFCHCGCGQRTTVAKYDDLKSNVLAGQPYPFVRSHQSRPPLEERFWSRVDKNGPDGCWVWVGHRNSLGYGMIGTRGHGKRVLMRAHRLSYIFAYGPIEDESLEVCHKCDRRECVRPDHLFLGTHAENMQDMSKKGRWGESRSRKGGNNPGAKLTNKQAKKIRAMYKTGEWSHLTLAKEFGVSKTIIGRILRRKTYI